MKTTFANANDTLLERAIDNGSAFASTLPGQTFTANGACLRITTGDKPVWLLDILYRFTSTTQNLQFWEGGSLDSSTSISLATSAALNRTVDNPVSAVIEAIADGVHTGGVPLKSFFAGNATIILSAALGVLLKPNTQYYLKALGPATTNTGTLTFIELPAGTFA